MGLLDRFFKKDDVLKKKLFTASKQIEFHKREVANLRFKLENRRQSLFERAVKSQQNRDENSAKIYSSELAEVKKVLQVVKSSELALSQIMIRIESIRDVADVFANMNTSFNIMRGINKSVSGVVPTLENASEEVNNTLTETLANLGNLSPSISLDLKNEDGYELFVKAKQFAEEKAMEINEVVPSSLLSGTGDTMLKNAEKIALLSSGEPNDSFENDFKVTMLSHPDKNELLDNQVYNYIMNKNKRLNVLEAAATLNVSPDEIEKVVFNLVSNGRLKEAQK